MNRLLLVSLLAASTFAHAGFLVTDVTGHVVMDDTAPLKTLAEVPDGSSVTLTKGAQLTMVDLTSGREFHLNTAGKYVFASDGPKGTDGKSLAGKSLPVKNLANVRLGPVQVSQASVVMRSVPKFNVPLLRSPARTTAITITPKFVWSGVEGASSYRLIVNGQDGPKWETETPLNELILPDAKALQPGQRYNWRVEAIGTDGRVISDSAASFLVASTDVILRLAELKPVSDESFGRRVLYATQLREAGAIEEAKIIWKALLKDRPDDEVLKALAK